jgi:Acyl-coenzyme A:6-aminopenicillanic acid acyl-transferase
MHTRTRTATVFLAVAVLAYPANAQDAANKTVRLDKVVAGSPKEALEVRHVVLKGTNEEIGRALAVIAKERFDVGPEAASDKVRVRAQRRYFEKNYPILFDRMRGAAGAFGKRVDDDAWNVSNLAYVQQIRAGCSVMYFPPGVTADKTGILSRDYDFSTGTILGEKPPAGRAGDTSRPYVVEMYPDRGYPSIAMYSYDLLSGVLDGMNSEGLTVTLMADDELISKYGFEPTGDTGVGLGVLQTLRLLLDTCASVEEAKEALLTTKQYYEFIPVHYLIADRHGKAFVWEYSQAHNKEYIIENPGKPLVATNFSLHRYLEDGKVPSAAKVKTVCSRYCLLADRLGAQKDPLTVDFIKETHKQVDAHFTPKGTSRAPTRTLWHALYVPEKRSVQISYYLRDEPDPAKEGATRDVRSDYLQFALRDPKDVK